MADYDELAREAWKNSIRAAIDKIVADNGSLVDKAVQIAAVRIIEGSDELKALIFTALVASIRQCAEEMKQTPDAFSPMPDGRVASRGGV